jgi:hypothetical protein
MEQVADKTYEAEKEVVCTDVLPYETSEPSMDRLRAEIEKRKKEVATRPRTEWVKVTWMKQGDIENEFIESWMNSPGHRNNILTTDFDEAGVGVAEVNDFIIATQVFIQRAECGYETGPCCQIPGYLPTCFHPLKCVGATCKTY